MSRLLGSLYLLLLLLSVGLQGFWSLQFPIYHCSGKTWEFLTVAVAILGVTLEGGRLFAGSMVTTYTEEGECDLDPFLTLRLWASVDLLLTDVLGPFVVLFGAVLCHPQPELLFCPKQTPAEALDPAGDLLLGDPHSDDSGTDDAAANTPPSPAAIPVTPSQTAAETYKRVWYLSIAFASWCSSVGLARFAVQASTRACSVERAGVYLYDMSMWQWTVFLNAVPAALWMAGVGWGLWRLYRWPGLLLVQGVVVIATVAGACSAEAALYCATPSRFLGLCGCVWAHCRVFLSEPPAPVERRASQGSPLRFMSLLNGADGSSDNEE
eukprot:EG_transcript_14943